MSILTDFITRKYRKFKRRSLARLVRNIDSLRDVSSLNSVNSERELSLRKRLMFRWLRSSWLGYQLLPTVGYSAASAPISALTHSEPYVVEAPRVPGALSIRAEGIFPAIEARCFKSAEASALSSTLLLSGRASIPDYYTTHDRAVITDGSKLIWQSNDGWSIASRPKPIPMAKGIMLFASGANNWYHWLIEVLPVAFLAGRLPQQYADFPIVIPARIANLPTFRDSLDVFRQGREVIAIGDENHLFDQLVVIDPPVREPMNLRQGHWPTIADYSYNPALLLEYRSAIQARLGVQTMDPRDRIFLARAHGRRSYNQDELLAIAERHGFRAVHIEKLSFCEQVELLSGAKFVVGPSGAAFANTLFCSQGTRLLTWLIPQYNGFCSYMNLARTVGSELRYVFATPNQEVRSTFEAYSAEYVVDPVEFERALVKALTSDDY